MTTSLPLSTYEKINPLKKVSYWIVYLSAGLLFFFLSELVLNYFGEDEFFAIRIYIAFVIGVIPPLLTEFSKGFITRANDLSKILWEDFSEFEKWRNDRYVHIFTLKSKQSKITCLGLVIAVVVTILVLGLPLKNTTLGIIALVGFTPTVFILAQSAYVCAELIFTLTELAKRKPNVPFFKLPHPSLTGLYSEYALLSVLLSIGYALLFWAAWDSPYGLSTIILIWLSILACYPVATFLWAITQVHVLMQKVKQSHLEIINHQIQVALQKINETQESAAYDQLTKAIEIQNKVQSLPEFPISISGTVTFFITSATAIIQITVSILQVFKP